MLVDTHCHLNLDVFTEDLDEVITRSIYSGIEKIIIPGVDLESSQKAIEISKKYPSCFAAIGIHPNYATSASLDKVNEIASLVKENKVVAIGEIGLDLFRDFAPLPIQVELLNQQLNISKTYSLPVILHSRSAISELITVISNWKRSLSEDIKQIGKNPGIMHAFEGTFEEAQLFHDLGFFIGIGGAITYSPSRVDPAIVKGLPVSSFVFETDAPYLSPMPWRGKRNEPSFLRSTVEFFSNKKGMEFSELCKISTESANMVFQLEQF